MFGSNMCKNYSALFALGLKEKIPSIKVKNILTISMQLKACLIKWSSNSNANTWTSEKFWGPFSAQDTTTLVLLKCIHWLCEENIPLSKFKSLQRLHHDLGLQDIALLKERTIQNQSYFSGLEFAESLSDIAEEELKEICWVSSCYNIRWW